MWIELLLFLSILIYSFYKWSIKNYKFFEKRGVPFERPLPLIGNAWPLIKNKQNAHKTFLDLYNKQKQNKVFGLFSFRDPVFIINDPEIIKKITIKDFDAFMNHQRFVAIESDPLLRCLVSVMKDQRWRNMRNTLTPGFTGAKMRAMFVLMNECFEEALTYLNGKFENGQKTVELELKDCFSRLSNDLIATTAFGLKVNSFENKNNEFFEIGKTLTDTSALAAVKFLMLEVFPKLFQLLKIRFIAEKTTNYFVSLVVDAMKYRKQHGIVRPDMIQLLMEAKRESPHHWTDEEIVAQCLIFFFAAFENNATYICTTCFELADNPEIQEKLYGEILETQKSLKGKTLDYDALQQMKYLDLVMQESLRKWTLIPNLDRECNKDYQLKDDDGNLICEFKAGDQIMLQIIGLHRDAEYFKEPEVFKPERFDDEHKHEIKSFTYLPFGVGPRACIGNRYALMQAKAMLFYLLKEFKVQRSDKLSKNLLDDCRSFSITPKDGFWFKLSNRAAV